jgi:hypothetical protein
VTQIVAQKSRCRILPGCSLLSIVHHNKKLFQFVNLCLLAVLLFGVIVYDGDFTNYDPPFQALPSWIVIVCHFVETRLIKRFEEIVYLPITDKFVLSSRAPPVSWSSENSC